MLDSLFSKSHFSSYCCCRTSRSTHDYNLKTKNIFFNFNTLTSQSTDYTFLFFLNLNQLTFYIYLLTISYQSNNTQKNIKHAMFSFKHPFHTFILVILYLPSHTLTLYNITKWRDCGFLWTWIIELRIFFYNKALVEKDKSIHIGEIVIARLRHPFHYSE